MTTFTKFQPVAVADIRSDTFEPAFYLGELGNEEYPHTVLLESAEGFEVEHYRLCTRTDKEGYPIRSDVDRAFLLEHRQELQEQEKYLTTAVEREQSNLSNVLSTLAGIEKELKELDSNN